VTTLDVGEGWRAESERGRRPVGGFNGVRDDTDFAAEDRKDRDLRNRDRILVDPETNLKIR
jgi:hypothetical protein